MPKAAIKCDAIECDDLIFSMGQYHCLRNRRKTDGDNCMKCKFITLSIIEARLKERKNHG